LAPKSRSALFWRKNDTPSALISGAILGAFLKGRYANRSITTPRRPQPMIAATNIAATATQAPTEGLTGPPRACKAYQPMNAPIM
jgi:hypothetical protein